MNALKACKPDAAPPLLAVLLSPVAVGADALLDLVRDPGVLPQRVRDHGRVLVELPCARLHVPRCHLTSR